VLINGGTRRSFNSSLGGVNDIQAAAPDGVAGDVQVSYTSIDIAGSLKSLSAESLNVPRLASDLCRVGAGSSLTPVARGGLRPMAKGFICPDNAFTSTTQISTDA
jgi:hypothetical protein